MAAIWCSAQERQREAEQDAIQEQLFLGQCAQVGLHMVPLVMVVEKHRKEEEQWAVLSSAVVSNVKGYVNEYCQKKQLIAHYQVVPSSTTTGFQCKLTISNCNSTSIVLQCCGSGAKKKDAQNEAATHMVALLKKRKLD